ncbi:MAG: ketoacyl-ACP synthase III, partial [Nitrospirota bacterium]|nr:ketoacyl-ACP synthase III [Nitrospirota bacterium]
MNSLILGTGAYVPNRVLTNADLERMVETSDTWIVERTGIRERRVVEPGQACSDLAVEAAQRALMAADVAPSEIDLILLATCTGDSPLPSTACLIQHRLGAKRAAACDISAACCGFVYALAIADAYVKNGMRHVLVIGSEVMSAITDWTDRNTCVLFGDGAGAVVVGQGHEGSGILSTHLHANGGLSDMIQVPGGGSREPASEQIIQEKRCFIKMKGNETFKIAVKSMEEATKEALDANKLTMDDVDLFIPHQANMRILNAVSQRLGLAREKL